MELAWTAIGRPGSYLLVDGGNLVRIPQEALGPGRTPLFTVVAKRDVHVVKLSDDPNEAIPVLRNLAAEQGYSVNF